MTKEKIGIDSVFIWKRSIGGLARIASRLALSCLLVYLSLIAIGGELYGQELRASVRISTEALGNVERSHYQALEKQIQDMLNTTQWSKIVYAPNERIVCNFSLNILAVEDEIRHKTELSVTASRTVYNTNYTTTTFVYRDKELSFDYTNGDRLEYNPQSLDNPLSASLALYAMLIIATDLDSYAPLGGNLLKSPIQNIISTASTQPNWQGWRAIDSDTNRASLAEGSISEQSREMRTAWYTYHRKGLDLCAKTLEEGRRNILLALKAANEWKKSNFRSPLLALWETAKVDELVKLFELAPRDERNEVYSLLLDLFPTRGDLLQKLKN